MLKRGIVVIAVVLAVLLGLIAAVVFNVFVYESPRVFYNPDMKNEDPPVMPGDGLSLVGEGLLLDPVRGNFIVTIPIIDFAGADDEHDLKLYYDSVKAVDRGPYGAGRPLGLGWQHSLQKRLRYTNGYYELCDVRCHALFDEDGDNVYTKRFENNMIELEVTNQGKKTIRIKFKKG